MRVRPGPTCTAADHVLVFKDVARDFLEHLKRTVVGFYGADPQQSPDYGRIVNAHHRCSARSFRYWWSTASKRSSESSTRNPPRSASMCFRRVQAYPPGFLMRPVRRRRGQRLRGAATDPGSAFRRSRQLRYWQVSRRVGLSRLYQRSRRALPQHVPEFAISIAGNSASRPIARWR